MPDIVISVENLGKQYTIGHQQERYSTLRDTLSKSIKQLFNLFRQNKMERETIWALKNIKLEIKQGEVVGIIGRNGAGKTTLLKVLSRITDPSEGRIRLRGRVGSLLEVGTGFHPELTGRENIYLNGAILGMKKAEIERRFDEIVAFAEMEKFLDTQVKFYSSGMYMRLAFSVAAHLEPEILLVDEVLAVGDANFQKRCLNKMQEIGKGGRTVLFVSHNMPAITRLCGRALLIDQGRVIRDGPATEVTSWYLVSDLGTCAERRWEDIHAAPGNDVVRLRAVRVRTEEGKVTESVAIRQPVGIEMEYWVLKPKVLTPNIHVFDSQGTFIFVSNDSYDSTWGNEPRHVGLWKSTCWIPGNLLAEGTHIIGAAISTMNPVLAHFYERDAVSFQVVDSLDGNTARGKYAGPLPGVIRPLLKWTAEYQHLVPGPSLLVEGQEK